MNPNRLQQFERKLAAFAIGLGLSTVAVAETTGFSGAASVTIKEFVGAENGQTGTASKAFPSPDGQLPLQVVTSLRSGEGRFPSAAAAAAQFADPTTVSGDNPEEFAINLTLSSVDPSIRYEAIATASESRDIVFAAGELSRNSADGDVAELVGRLFVDGALTVIAVEADRDLTGAFVRLSVEVVKSQAGVADEIVYFGRIELRGQSDANVVVASEGDFPTGRLILTNLASLSSDFSAFRVLIIPRIDIDYEYTATVGQPFTLTARVEVEAANIPDNVGVAAVIGTPADTLSDVIGVTTGSSAATKVVDAIRAERDDPTGDPAFPDDAPRASLPFCGLFGLEGLIGISAIIGLRGRIRRVVARE